jgi:hypothetical protein
MQKGDLIKDSYGNTFEIMGYGKKRVILRACMMPYKRQGYFTLDEFNKLLLFKRYIPIEKPKVRDTAWVNGQLQYI